MYDRSQKKLGIYVHIPFCKTKCAYCDFYSFIPKSEGIYERYADTVIAHMEAYRDAARDRAPDSVYIGGGTHTREEWVLKSSLTPGLEIAIKTAIKFTR